MLLAVDVGNTQTVLGLYEAGELAEDWRVATDRTRTGDELFFGSSWKAFWNFAAAPMISLRRRSIRPHVL